MSELKGEVGELQMTIRVKRKESGEVEVYQVTGKQEESDGGHTLDGSEKRGD